MSSLLLLLTLLLSQLPARPGPVWHHLGRTYVTGYDTGTTTATGTRARRGECAVDPGTIPLGATVWIVGLTRCHAEDTGGAVLGKHVDVYVANDDEANALTRYYDDVRWRR